jgi:hypothetical protein
MGVKVTKKLKSAIALAEQRFMVQLNEGSRDQLGRLAVRAFWSGLWDGIAVSNAEPPLESSPWALATA